MEEIVRKRAREREVERDRWGEGDRGWGQAERQEERDTCSQIVRNRFGLKETK
jgi:hypothetical protein